MEGNMKIKLAILDKDVNYLKRLVTVFSTKYAEQVEAYSFTDSETALSVLSSAKIDVLLAGEEFDLNPDSLPKRCGFSYLVDSPDVSTHNGQTAVCKFQRAELIYRQILGIYAEKTASVAGHAVGDGSAEIISFSSPAGGVGTSTLAAACALYFTARGRRCLFLCLEPFGAADQFFSGEGQSDLSDIIFALKSRKVNFAMKLESCVKKSGQGVYFYSRPKVALDLLELSEEETLHLIDEVRMTGGYDYIILDLGLFDMKARTRNLHRQAQTVVWVSDGSELVNNKLRRAYESLDIRETNEDRPLTNLLCLAYNRFSSKTGQQLEDLPIRALGGGKRFENRTAEQVAVELAQLEIFEHLIQD